MTTTPTTPSVAAGAAIATALLPLAGPDGQLAATVLTQGLAFWADYASRMSAGQLTLADVQAAAAGLNIDMEKLAADIAAAP
jgi:hypothetical protein